MAQLRRFYTRVTDSVNAAVASPTVALLRVGATVVRDATSSIVEIGVRHPGALKLNDICYVIRGGAIIDGVTVIIANAAWVYNSANGDWVSEVLVGGTWTPTAGDRLVLTGLAAGHKVSVYDNDLGAGTAGDPTVGSDGTVSGYVDAVDVDVKVTSGGSTTYVTDVPTEGRKYSTLGDFGAAIDGATDDTKAAQILVEMAADGTAYIDLLGKTLRLTANVSVALADSVVVRNGTISLDEAGAFVVSVATKTVFRDVTWTTTKTGTSAATALSLAADDCDFVLFDHCKFGRVKIVARDADSSTAAANLHFTMRDCLWEADYTGITGNDANNLVDVRGWEHVKLDGNTFHVDGIERVGKISGACRDVFIVNNSVKVGTTTIGKQLFDLFADAQRVVIQGNTVILNGEYSCVFENKNGDNNSADAEPAEIIVSNNVITGVNDASVFAAICLYGAWGLAEQTLVSNSVIVSDNIISVDRNASDARGLIIVRGFTHANVSNNVLWQDSTPSFGISIEVSNCEFSSICGNVAEWGRIMVDGEASHPGSTLYGSQPDSVVISGNLIAGSNSSSGAINIFDCSSLDSLIVSNNIAENAAGNYLVIDGTSVVAKQQVVGNSWGDSYFNAAGELDLASAHLLGYSQVETNDGGSPTSWTTISSATIPQNRLGAGQAVKVVTWGKFNLTNGTKDARLMLGATELIALTQSTSAQQYDWRMEAYIAFNGAASQYISAIAYLNQALDTTTNVSLTATEDLSAGDLTLAVQALLGSASDNVTVGGFVIEYIGGV